MRTEIMFMRHSHGSQPLRRASRLLGGGVQRIGRPKSPSRPCRPQGPASAS